MAYIVMACVALAYTVMAYIAVAHLTSLVTAYVVMAYVVVAHIAMAYTDRFLLRDGWLRNRHNLLEHVPVTGQGWADYALP